MTWVKATGLDGNAIYVNMLQARLVVASDAGGSTVVFGEDDAVDVREQPENLLREQPLFPGTLGVHVGLIPRPGTDDKW